ncbi:hypothetical protein H5410_052607 [Solanum commersonii]|uniref:Uncharacterized protein n=1 Tax=Solanum commersonii TaxID=4109 RepID=A0A9J5X3V3_SOLCO|nr:hypothetical protein H5410_052607 [Solanum commersonii]
MIDSILSEILWITIYDQVVVQLLRRITGKDGKHLYFSLGLVIWFPRCLLFGSFIGYLYQDSLGILWHMIITILLQSVPRKHEKHRRMFLILENSCFDASHSIGKANWLPQDLKKETLYYSYFLITTLGILNLVCFIIYVRWYKYKETGDTSNVTLEKNC